MRLFLITLALVFSASTAMSASMYALFDHDEGGEADNFDYGLRMEDIAGNAVGSYWSFEDANGQSLATLTVDIAGQTASISGSMRYNDADADDTNDEIWSLTATMTGVEAIAGLADGSFGAADYEATLTNSDNSITYDILGKSKDVNGVDYEWTLFLSDPGGNADWRAPNITAGWLSSRNGGQNTAMLSGTNDFIAQVEAVPLPAGMLLMLTGVGALAVRSRKRKSQA